MQRLVVVALFEPLGAEARFSMSAWPPHVTLAPSFSVDETRQAVAEAVARAVSGERALSIRFAGGARFGPAADIPVQLVDSPPVVSLHARLADGLARLTGFTAEEPAYWREGYRPHLTDVPSIAVREGDHRELPYVVAVEMTSIEATVVSCLRLAG